MADSITRDLILSFRVRSVPSRPQMCNCTSGNDKRNDPTYRYADRIDRDRDVVAAGGTDGGDRKNSRVPAGGDDVRDRSAGRISHLDRATEGDARIVAAAAGVDRRGRWSLRLPRAVLPGAALCASGRSRFAELSLAAADRVVLVVAA